MNEELIRLEKIINNLNDLLKEPYVLSRPTAKVLRDMLKEYSFKHAKLSIELARQGE